MADKFVELFGEKLVSKGGEVATKDAVAGKKNIMVYFSAHWCPPCRGFTPQLVKAYKESTTADKETMVIFVSSDKDQAAFDEYYGEMPWHSLPFSERDLKDKISEKFEVKGIPMLIVLDDSANLVTANGRAEFMKYLPAGADAAPAAAKDPAIAMAMLGEDEEANPFTDLFGAKLVSKDGEVSTKDAVAGKKTVLVYFSAHWCPPCRGFTPSLAQGYKDSAIAGKETMIIFVSSDKDQASFDGYYAEMPWHALPFNDRGRKGKLSEKFSVQGIPTLVVLDEKAQLVTCNGRAEYQKWLTSTAGVGGEQGNKAACCTVS